MSIDQPILYATYQHNMTSIFMPIIDVVVPKCENPSVMNKWWRCVLSALKGDLLRIMRIIITLTVSNTGTHNTANVNGTIPRLESKLVSWG